MNQVTPGPQLRFFMTADAPCPYLEGQVERKIFTNLSPRNGADVNDALSNMGFRRSQNIAYRPACQSCQACLSVRIPVPEFTFSRGQRKILNRNQDLTRALVEAEATLEQFDLLQRYLSHRHPDGGMTGMGLADYICMIEDTSVRTHLIEYRLEGTDNGPGELVGVCLTDLLSDGLSMVYSFFDPALERRSLGQFAILDHLRQSAQVALPYLYLGYWVQGSPKMDYKARYRPMEALAGNEWRRLPPLQVVGTEVAQGD